LTKGIIPLGEEKIFDESDGIPVDVVESSATLCIQPMLKKVWPVKLGVGIGVEGDNTSTGPLGAVVKHKESGELFSLSNAHVLCREGRSSLTIVQPSQQDYEEMESCENKAIEEHKKERDTLKATINWKRSLGCDVQRLEENVAEKDNKVKRMEEEWSRGEQKQCPRKIGTFSSKGVKKHFVKKPDYFYREQASSKAYGVDAAIALIEQSEFEPEYMTEMYTWPDGLDGLRGEDGKNVTKIAINGNFLNEKEGQKALASEAVVYKCGRTTGITKGKLLQNIDVIRLARWQ
jgi:hypothetical protein